jgi:hypothetical protein
MFFCDPVVLGSLHFVQSIERQRQHACRTGLSRQQARAPLSYQRRREAKQVQALTGTAVFGTLGGLVFGPLGALSGAALGAVLGEGQNPDYR